MKVKPIAVLDIETTIHLEQAFLVGFYDGKSYRVYQDRRPSLSQPHYPEDARGPVSQFLTSLLSDGTYCGHWIYAHNGGSFDFLYLIRWLIAHTDEYSFNVVPLQSSILCLEVSDKPSVSGKRKTPRTWTFLDSYRLMNASLEKLGKALVGQGKTPKLLLDGSEVNEKDPKSVDKFYRTLHRNPQRYEYLRQDCVLLYQCLQAFTTMVTSEGGEIGMTAPSSAMKSFRRMHLDKWIPINAHLPECECE